MKVKAEIDITKGGLFKYIFTKKSGIKYMARLISYITNLGYEDLKDNIELYPTELVRNSIGENSSFCDVV